MSLIARAAGTARGASMDEKDLETRRGRHRPVAVAGSPSQPDLSPAPQHEPGADNRAICRDSQDGRGLIPWTVASTKRLLPPSRKLMRHQTRLLPSLAVIAAQIGKIRFGSAHQLSTSPQVGGSLPRALAISCSRIFCISVFEGLRLTVALTRERAERGFCRKEIRRFKPNASRFRLSFPPDAADWPTSAFRRWRRHVNPPAGCRHARWRRGRSRSHDQSAG
jgi:hypothetical protein